MAKKEAAPLVTTPPQKTSANEVQDNHAATQPQRLSNRLTVLAEDLKIEAEAFAAAERASAEHAVNAGRLLCEAKQACRHGEWLPFLKRAGVPERSAQRWMKLHRSGLKSDLVSDLGGVASALNALKDFETWVEELARLANTDNSTLLPRTAETEVPADDGQASRKFQNTEKRPARTRQQWAEVINASYGAALLAFAEEGART